MLVLFLADDKDYNAAWLFVYNDCFLYSQVVIQKSFIGDVNWRRGSTFLSFCIFWWIEPIRFYLSQHPIRQFPTM